MLIFLHPGYSRADARCTVIYPLDKTSVELATITIFGMACDPQEVPRIILNRQGVIPQMSPAGFFRQSVHLNRGLNILKVDRSRYFISFDPPGKAPPQGYVRRDIHEPVLEDCTNCHDFSAPGEIKLLAEVPELCLECHDDPAEGLSQAHGAMEEGCTACHAPHLWEEGRPFKKGIPELCYQCHDEQASGKHVHEPAAEGDCLACHGAHGSDNRTLLVADGASLCLQCHDDPADGGKNVHPALEEGCLECHAAHSSDNPGLMVAEGTSLCLQCHDDPAAGRAVVHEALGEGCITCHDPHASSSPALLEGDEAAVCGNCHDDIPPTGLRIRGHSPISDDGQCSPCHDPHAGGERNLLTGSVPGLCYDCHDDVSALAGEKGTVHSPVQEGACTDCHNPHGGPSALLVKEPVCFECHDPMEKPDSGSIHDPVEAGECFECHSPHSSPQRFLLKGKGTGLCYACHDEFEGDVVHSPIADDDSCAECHLPHVAPAPRLLEDAGMKLCLQCHDDPTEGYNFRPRSTIHSPIRDDAECTPCHSPHAGQRSLLREGIPTLCKQCHDDVTQRSDGRWYDSIHSPVAEGACMDCHRPHASPGGNLLVTAGSAVLCFECHDDPSHKSDGSEWTFRHPPAEEDCGGCHVPHGSDEKGNLKKSQWELCRSCHPDHDAHSLDASSADESSTVKIPEDVPLTEDGMLVCTTCHRPHGGGFPSLLKEDRSKLCVLCH